MRHAPTLSLVAPAFMLCLLSEVPPVSADTLTGPDAGLLGHWRLAGDGKDSSGKGNDGIPAGVVFDAIGPGGESNVARFDGRGAAITVPDGPGLRLGTQDLSISLWLHTGQELDDVIGDLLGKFDPATRRGLNLCVKHHAGMTSSSSNYRNVEFGLDAGTEPAWADCGRPGEAVFICSMAVHQGSLYVGTYEFGADRGGRVYRYDADGQWVDCGSPDGANSVMSMAVYDGKLMVGTACYRAKGSALENSPNATPGGHVYEYAGGSEWRDRGRLAQANDVYGMAVFRGELYAIPMYSPGVFRLEGQDTWVPCGVPGDQRSMSLAVWNGDLYVTGNGSAGVLRYLGGSEWEHCGNQEQENQVYALAAYSGELYVGSWPSGKAWRYAGGKEWEDCGRLGEEKEVMSMGVYNGKLYCGTLPLGQVYRYEADGDWTLLRQIDATPEVLYRRVWTMAQYDGQLFSGVLPSGHVWRMRTGQVATMDRELPAGWHHLAAVRQGGQVRLYLDGRLTAEAGASTAAPLDLTAAVPLTIGSGMHDTLCGCLYDVRLYGRELTEEQIGELAAER